MPAEKKKAAEEKPEEKPVEEKKDAPAKAPEPRGGADDLRRIVAMIEKAVETNQTRIIGRALRHNGPLRQLATKEVLAAAVATYVPEGEARAALLAQLAALSDSPAPSAAPAAASVAAPAAVDNLAMEVEAVSLEEAAGVAAPRTSVLPEVEVYLALLVLTTLLRTPAVPAAACVAAAEALASRASAHNRRSLDGLRAKAFHFLSLAHERNGSMAALRPRLLAAHRTACLQHDEVGQATLLNLLLRSLLAEDQVEQAFKLVSQTTFPEKASNNQFCRYLYYTGRISALQLEYGDAYEKLKSSLRKAPHHPAVAPFRRTVQKLMVIVSLLMGEVPERKLFNEPDLRAALVPYLALTKAVREGNLAAFHAAVQRHQGALVADKMLSLVVRLSHSVVKTGLRRINVAYSRISLVDVCAKLALDSPASAESVCLKAIRDGVIDAEVDHANGWLSSAARPNAYATNEPQRAFHQRVEFCLAVRNEAVKAMRYPADAFKPQAKKAKDSKEVEKSPEEIAKEIEEEYEDEDGI